ncbi:DUF6714 family protein [Microscilla marina]
MFYFADFLEPAGFHYYLPAYMILSLNEDNIKIRV